jgi:hypothetical protein
VRSAAHPSSQCPARITHWSSFLRTAPSLRMRYATHRYSGPFPMSSLLTPFSLCRRHGKAPSRNSVPIRASRTRHYQARTSSRSSMHMSHCLRKRHISLNALFAALTDARQTPLPPAGVLPLAPPVARLGLTHECVLRREFATWDAERGAEVREAYDAILGENAFLELLGRMSRMAARVWTVAGWRWRWTM